MRIAPDMRVTVVTPPNPVISFAEAAEHLRLGRNQAEKTLVEAFIAAATGHIDGPEGWLRRSLGPQTLEARFTDFVGGSLVRLPFGPVITLVAVEFLDANDDPVQANIDDFELMGNDLAAVGSSFAWEGCSTRREAIRVQYVAGYEYGIPAPIRAAILLMVGDLYRNRDTTAVVQMSAVPMSTTVEGLLQPYRVFG